jgi:hypothetical protein
MKAESVGPLLRTTNASRLSWVSGPFGFFFESVVQIFTRTSFHAVSLNKGEAASKFQTPSTKRATGSLKKNRDATPYGLFTFLSP